MLNGLRLVIAGDPGIEAGVAASTETLNDEVGTEEPAKLERDMAIRLGGAVKMEFVWIEALKGWVGKFEVTNEEYRRFKKDHDSGSNRGRPLDDDRQPVCRVTFDEATAFADWLNRKASSLLPPSYKVRLPDGREWLTFAQCGDGRAYPWGNDWPPKYGKYSDAATRRVFFKSKVANDDDDGSSASCLVEDSGANDWGLYGVGGNVWEWTTEENDSLRVLRGASWSVDNQDLMRCAVRIKVDPAFRVTELGFRLVVLP
jgi:formylglycine-generating enzyme required for sulfatase activity